MPGGEVFAVEGEGHAAAVIVGSLTVEVLSDLRPRALLTARRPLEHADGSRGLAVAVVSGGHDGDSSAVAGEREGLAEDVAAGFADDGVPEREPGGGGGGPLEHRDVSLLTVAVFRAHGETGAVVGELDVPAETVGDGRRLRDVVANLTPRASVASPLEHAHETALGIAIGEVGVDVRRARGDGDARSVAGERDGTLGRGEIRDVSADPRRVRHDAPQPPHVTRGSENGSRRARREEHARQEARARGHTPRAHSPITPPTRGVGVAVAAVRGGENPVVRRRHDRIDAFETRRKDEDDR